MANTKKRMVIMLDDKKMLEIPAGKQIDVIVEIVPEPKEDAGEGYTLTPFGLARVSSGSKESGLSLRKLIVWADPGYVKVLAAVPGVVTASKTDIPIKYNVKVDPRFDLAWVVEEIKAAVKLNTPGVEKPEPENKQGFMGGYITLRYGGNSDDD